MRTAFIQELIRQARQNPRLFLVVGDLGFSVVEPFIAEFPERFLNAGVAEQNMTGVAAGLASEGYHVFTYSIANFPTLRCLEQIRNDVCYHRLPVTITAVGSGLAYGNLGYSHHGIQDLGILRSLHGMKVLSPADPGETSACVDYLVRFPGPSYLRLGKAGEAQLHEIKGLEHGPLPVRTGDARVALVATGSVLSLALEAADQLKNSAGRDISVFSCPWLSPIPPGFFAALEQFRAIITIEEHIDVGGLADLLRASLPRTVQICPMSLAGSDPSRVGSQDYLRREAGLRVDRIIGLVEANGG